MTGGLCASLRHLPADARARAQKGFAMGQGAAHDGGARHAALWPEPETGAGCAAHSIPSLATRSGLRAGSPARADRQGFAHRVAAGARSREIRLASRRIALGFRATTTLNGGSLSCVKPISFLLFSPLRPCRPACRPMANARLSARAPVRLLRMRPTRTWSPAPRWARWPAPIATTLASASNRATLHCLTGGPAGRGGIDMTCAIGASRPGGAFIFTTRNEFTTVRTRGAQDGAAATEGKD